MGLSKYYVIKHKPLLIAALAHDTESFFEEADRQLAAVKKDDIVGKWRKYLQLKQVFYNSYTYCYKGLAFLSEDKCGDAVKCLQEAKSQFLACEKKCKGKNHFEIFFKI